MEKRQQAAFCGPLQPTENLQTRGLKEKFGCRLDSKATLSAQRSDQFARRTLFGEVLALVHMQDLNGDIYKKNIKKVQKAQHDSSNGRMRPCHAT